MAKMYVDVHAHLDLAGYDIYGGVDKVIAESFHNGVKIIITNGTDVESNRRILDIAKKHHCVKTAMGIYPTHCLEMIQDGRDETFDEELEFIQQSIKEKRCIAIGEVGLEYSEIQDIDETKKRIQKDCLKRFITMAKALDVPIIIHSRGAELDVIELLEEEGMKGRKVLMHCFSGRKHLVQRIRDNRWYLSIPCNIERSLHFQQIVKDTAVEQLLTETDAPYLSPVPGTINRPDNVRIAIKKIADIKGLTEEETANMIYSNFQRLFL